MMELKEELLQKYQLVVGLEVHIQLLTRSKAYSGDVNSYGDLPNSNTCPLTLGHPGTLPRLNAKSLTHAIKLGLATNCTIHKELHFARKNYFYPDLPKGYQITQDKTPICTNGYLEITDAHGKNKRIGITRIHLEEDAGKSIHDQDPDYTLVDLNRAGVPLLEIVSEPDIRSIEEAYNYLAEIRKLVRYLEVCDGNMEEGSMRCDANVSVMPKGSTRYGQRCEVKNMNSLRNVQRAITYEMSRQIAEIEAGRTIPQQTRSFDAVRGLTFALRSKEEAHDYRYFPEPDLPPLRIDQEAIEEVRKHMPPLPSALFTKYKQELNLSAYDSALLSEEREVAMYFEAMLRHTANAKAAANWLMGDVKSYLNSKALSFSEFAIPPESLAELIALVDEGAISHSQASQQLFPALLLAPESMPRELAKKLQLIQLSDSDWLSDLAAEVLAQFPEKVKAYQAGNKGLLGLFMGEMMKRSERKANPKLSSEILQKLLNQ